MKSPNNRPYSEVRSREYLSKNEVEKLIEAIKQGSRYPHRDSTLILVMFRHALRISEVVALKWEQIDLQNGRIHVNRIKNGISLYTTAQQR